MDVPRPHDVDPLQLWHAGGLCALWRGQEGQQQEQILRGPRDKQKKQGIFLGKMPEPRARLDSGGALYTRTLLTTTRAATHDEQETIRPTPAQWRSHSASAVPTASSPPAADDFDKATRLHGTGDYRQWWTGFSP